MQFTPLLFTFLMLLISKIFEITGAAVLSRHHNFTVTSLITDSRQIVNADDHVVFIALHGEHYNGNMFFNDAYNKGIRNFIIDESIEITSYPETNILIVANTTLAMQQIAAYHRKEFRIPVIGITGSNGKTMVKEWLGALLEDVYNVVKNPGSYNSQVGVPLSVWHINSQHTIGIFEAGISKPGEMQMLEKIIAPTIGVFTTLSDAHNIGFNSQEDKIREKFLLFSNCKTVVLNYQYKKYLSPDQNAYSWSTTAKESTIFITAINPGINQTEISYLFNLVDFKFTIPFTDDASIENAISCLCVCLLLNRSNSELAQQFLHLQPVKMRLELQRGNNNNVIINDAYNSDLHGVKNALGFMHKQLHRGGKIVVLSDILQSGIQPDLLYREVAKYLNQFKILRLIGVGKEISKHQSEFNLPCQFYSSTEDLITDIKSGNLNINDSLVLLKGARSFHFEDIARAFSSQHHATCLEINLNSLAHNFHAYRKLINAETKMMVMVKAFSYGSGSNEIASLLQFLKADYLAVAYADEGVHLRNAGVTLPIMVMNTEDKSFELLTQYELEPAIFSSDQLHKLAAFSKEKMPVHLEFETGMHRLGFEANETGAIVSFLKLHPNLEVKSVFSHLASAEDEKDDDFTLQQIESFKSISQEITATFPKVLKHLLNSPGIIRWGAMAQFDMVRLGIGFYGIDPANRLNEELIPASTLKSSISQIKILKPGDSVSYNRRFIADIEMRIATIPIGYADGLSRALGNGNGSFIINGTQAVILGAICMDMTMVDITGIACDEGDDVIIFGGLMPVTSVASNAKTISYEILSALSQRIKRIYLHE